MVGSSSSSNTYSGLDGQIYRYNHAIKLKADWATIPNSQHMPDSII